MHQLVSCSWRDRILQIVSRRSSQAGRPTLVAGGGSPTSAAAEVPGDATVVLAGLHVRSVALGAGSGGFWSHNEAPASVAEEESASTANLKEMIRKEVKGGGPDPTDSEGRIPPGPMATPGRKDSEYRTRPDIQSLEFFLHHLDKNNLVMLGVYELRNDLENHNGRLFLAFSETLAKKANKKKQLLLDIEYYCLVYLVTRIPKFSSFFVIPSIFPFEQVLQECSKITRNFYACNQGKHRVTKRGPALSNPMFTLVIRVPRIVGRWRAVCVTAPQRPHYDLPTITASLFRYKHPTENELRALSGKLKPKAKKERRMNGTTDEKPLTVPRDIDLHLEVTPITTVDALVLRYFLEYQWFIDFSLYSTIIYLLTEGYYCLVNAQNEVNIGVLCKVLFTMMKHYFRSEEGGERSVCLTFAFFFMLIAMIVMVVREEYLEFGLEPGIDNICHNLEILLKQQGWQLSQ
ncbi:unnamed protein product [Ranitomeya imitator]|uniref:Transmembrane protein 161A n=1 Tax=Ranitomeya imitator TaxID=111125 RepID=A0ABN9LAM1_9NEOB|nr:unnamed protein product [Ranitomeya imitator]